MRDGYRRGRSPDSCSSIFVLVTKADADLPSGPPRALWVGTAGTANLMDETGAVLTDFPLLEGLNPIAPRQVRTGGTADNIWALY